MVVKQYAYRTCGRMRAGGALASAPVLSPPKDWTRLDVTIERKLVSTPLHKKENKAND